ncbi:MAG: metallophosphoesterase [Nannocystaceae bacterium]
MRAALLSSTLLAALTLAVGCQRSPSLATPYALPLTEPNGRALTGRFLLVSDNQLHHLYGDPYWTRTQIADRVIPSAIRPVQLDLFGRDLLRWALERPSARKKPIIHLGDATDIACVDELTAFFAVMRRATSAWFMAPGNHDMYFVGNGVFSPRHWQRACKRAGGPLDKNTFINMYLDQGLGGQDLTDWPGIAALTQHRARARERGRFARPGSLLTGVTWDLDERRPWRSYLVQRLELSWAKQKTPVIAILLDTNQYHSKPSLLPLPPLAYNAGLKGSLLDDQLAAVEELLDGPEEQLVLLMGHHSYQQLTRKSKARIDALRAEHRVLAYISAHTHAGHYHVRDEPSGEQRDSWIELNLGSMIDWPLEYRELVIKEIEDDPRRVTMVTTLHWMHREWFSSQEEGQQCDPSWEGPPEFYVGADAGYAFKSIETQRRVFNALLDTHAALLRSFPTRAPPLGSFAGDAAALAELTTARSRLAALKDGDHAALDDIAQLLFRLDLYDRQRQPIDHRGRDLYRLCQAFWASKYDRVAARQPIVDDVHIVIPKDPRPAAARGPENGAPP